MERAFHRVDVFADRLFGGNPACVFPDARGLDDDTLRAIAREMGAGATAFVLPPTRAECTHKVRFFKPMGEELRACGHATVATFAVHAAIGEAGPSAVMECGAGAVPVTTVLDAAGARVTLVQGEGRFRAFEDAAGKDGLARALGVSPGDVLAAPPAELASTGSGGTWVAIAPLRDVAAVAACAPSAAAIEALGASRVYAFAMPGAGAGDGPRARAHARYFFLEVNGKVDEDPVTGTAAGALAAWLDRHGRLARGETLVVEQGIECKRPGVVRAAVDEAGRVAITGSAVVAFTASLDV
jgi:trans-2,3-dihydro-3-hydroxyanthranilate isomerase